MCKLKGELEVQMVHEAVNNSINNTADTSSSNRNNGCHSCYIINNSGSNDSDSNSMNSNESCNEESASRPKVHRRKRHESAHRTTYIRDKFRDSSHSNSAASIFRDFHRHSQHPVSLRNNCNETNYHETSSSDSDSDGELSDVSNDEELKFQRAERSSSMLSFRKAVEDLLSDGKVDSSLLENFRNFFVTGFKKFM